MKFFFSIISHGHGKLISELDVIRKLSDIGEVIVKNNKEDIYIENYVRGNDINFINENFGLGFGENNNYVYNYCVERLGMSNDDVFIVLNPDVMISIESINELKLELERSKCKVFTINLFKDNEFSIFDDCIRKFPTLCDFILSFVGFKNRSVLDKNELNDFDTVDWAAGSFLGFRVSHYAKLNGFNEKYFMYCEDVDICYRSHLLNERVVFIKNVYGVHLAMHNNRKIFSKHFVWHLNSAFRFLATKAKLTSSKSSL